MARADTLDPVDDPYSILRKRAMLQAGGDEPLAPDPGGVQTTLDPAPFVTGQRQPPPGEDPTPTPDNPGGGTPTTPTTPTAPTTPTGPDLGGGGQPVAATDPDAARIAKIFGMQGKAATAVDIAYWKDVLARANGDWNYVVQRMLQPNTGGTQAGSYDATHGLASTGAGGPAITTPPPLGPTGYGYTGNASPGSTGSDFLAAIRKILMDRLTAAGQPVDENASGITGAVTGLRDELTRQSETERSQLAERGYAQGGLNTDLIARGIQTSNERNATATGGLRAQLIMKEYDSRRQELDQLLNIATQSGDTEMYRNVTMQIAELNAAVQREGLGVNLAEFQANLNANANKSLTGG